MSSSTVPICTYYTSILNSYESVLGARLRARGIDAAADIAIPLSEE